MTENRCGLKKGRKMLEVFLLGVSRVVRMFFVFFFNDTATTEIYTLSLYDALPICSRSTQDDETLHADSRGRVCKSAIGLKRIREKKIRSEEHTSETPVTRPDLVCRLLLEKKKTH